MTNQIVKICKDYLAELAIKTENEEQFWPVILKEIEEQGSSFSKFDSNPKIPTLHSSMSEKKLIVIFYFF